MLTTGSVFTAEDSQQVNTVSPPRYTATSLGGPTAAPERPSSGHASTMSDAELIDLLRRPPKQTIALKTKVGFQEFFRGVSAHHMRALLEQAYAEIVDENDRNAKISKRMDILQGVIW